jgi:hypothetical protein
MGAWRRPGWTRALPKRPPSGSPCATTRAGGKSAASPPAKARQPPPSCTRRLGRPILWAEGGWLHLWYEAYPLGPGAGASILHSVSTDGGRSWQRTRRLESGPFGGLGSRLGDIPRPLADGGVLLPLEEDGREGLAAPGGDRALVGQPRQLPSAAPAP